MGESGWRPAGEVFVALIGLIVKAALGTITAVAVARAMGVGI